MGSSELKINIAIDDVNPSPQYRILGTPVEKWLQTLHEQFGCKFTLFIPSNYHRKWSISQHKGWINELYDDPKFELAAHGHYHQCVNPAFGECEFFELVDEKLALYRLENCLSEWTDCYIEPVGWRNPGWLCSRESKLVIDNHFDYVALHYEHNHSLEWYYSKTFFGHDNINAENISIHNGDMIMFQSHIAGNHNLNVWNRHNFEQLQLSLSHLVEDTNNTYNFKFLKECL